MALLISVNRCATARLVAEIFFPQRRELGLNARSYSPIVVDKIVSANAEHKSAAKAQKMLRKLAEIKVSVPQIMEVSGEIGRELSEHLQEQAKAHANETLKPQHAEVPNLVAVSPDGGRIMTREEAGRGVHGQAWKETKNACLLTMSSRPTEQDPHPELPKCFCDRVYVEKLVREVHSTTLGESANIVETAGIPAEDPTFTDAASQQSDSDNQPPAAPSDKKWRPTRLMRWWQAKLSVVGSIKRHAAHSWEMARPGTGRCRKPTSPISSRSLISSTHLDTCTTSPRCCLLRIPGHFIFARPGFVGRVASRSY
jgi:hypothetical protein